MFKYSEIEKARKIGILENIVFLNLIEQMLESVENKGFYRTQSIFPTERITEVIIYDDGLL